MWRPWKLSIFQDPRLPLSSYILNSSNPLTLDIQFQTKSPLSPNDNHSGNIILGWLLYVIRYFLQVGFRFQYQLISFVWLSIDFFSLSSGQSRPQSNFKELKTSFSLSSYTGKMHCGRRWTEASLSTFPWLFHPRVCSCVYLILIHSSLCLIIESVYVHRNIEHTHSQLLNTKNCESISNKSVLNTNTSNEANNDNNVLKNLRLKNSNKVIIGHININSLRNKFEILTEMVRDKVDSLMISETKLDSSFSNAQFYMKSFSKPYRLDRNSKGGGIILYVREDIPSKLISSSFTKNEKEYFLVELNLRKQKWLIVCNYNHHKTRIKGHLECISKEINSH